MNTFQLEQKMIFAAIAGHVHLKALGCHFLHVGGTHEQINYDVHNYVHIIYSHRARERS